MRILNGNITQCEDCESVMEYDINDIIPVVACPKCGKLVKAKMPTPVSVSVFDDMSWDEICNMFPKAFMPGITKNITLKNGEQYAVQVTDRKDGLMLSFKDLYGHEDGGGMPINSEEDYKRKYEDCDLRKWLNSEFLNLLPDDLVKHIVPAEIVSDGKTLKDKIFIPSEIEVFGKDEYGRCREGEQLELYADWHNRISGYVDGQYGRWWWLRTKSKAGGSSFCGVYDCGYAGYNYVSDSLGVRPHFLIK
ncbi:MAG: YgdI/YgdR family lipoprotein [Clostridia bacterium]|nr:YgdI/YgdR family lipoprotein [Clostridia bacterium]